MLPIRALPAAVQGDSGRFSLSKVPCRAALLRMPDGRQHLLFSESGCALQLDIRGTSLSEPVRLLTDAVLPAVHLRARLATLEGLANIVGRGRFPDYRMIEPRGRRLRVVLQALDGWLAGAPYREIAVALFGEARVEADWRDPRDHLRDQVRRAVRRGRELMRGGYRKLLR
ncbi:DUF2285 domain-containing protein [Thalassospira sp. MIT1370]|uniref:DUF2285 domain-containing protein n=1 Tax=unclassified Thalassospira TaxID=2648997 RepID=UPI00399A34C3